MSKALERCGLDEPPVERHKGIVPAAMGYNQVRAEQVKAWPATEASVCLASKVQVSEPSEALHDRELLWSERVPT